MSESDWDRLCDLTDTYLVRAESAEAAHEALRKDIEALADCWEAEARRLGRSLSELMLREAAAHLRALLGGVT